MARSRPLLGRPHGVAWREAQGAILRHHRTERGLTQAELAEALGTTKGYISSIERARNVVAPEHVKGLAEALRVDLHALAVSLLYCQNPIMADLVWPDLAEAFTDQWKQVRFDEAAAELEAETPTAS